jgi:hypothetical protein
MCDNNQQATTQQNTCAIDPSVVDRFHNTLMFIVVFLLLLLQESMGMPMIYNLVTAAQEWLAARVAAGPAAAGERGCLCGAVSRLRDVGFWGWQHG